MNQRILLIEDDIELSELIANFLQNKGFEVEVENDGGPAVERIISSQPNLVIIDLNLPNQDGISICKIARQYYMGLIMMLTASSDDFDQVVALEIGVDDYVTKPIEPRVLLARINALFRRENHAVENVAGNNDAIKSTALKNNSLKRLVFKNMVINKSARKVMLNGDNIPLTTAEFDLLEYLAENAGEIIDRNALFMALKKYEYDGQNRFIDITVSQIRKKLGEQADDYIRTIRGKGYLFMLE